MLNTLANHGYLPHNGRNITAQDIGNAIFETTNWHSDFGVFPASAALTNLNVTHIDLADLNSSPGGEHPASLTRKDASSGDSNAIDTARTAQLFADSRTSFLTIDSVAKTRNRLDASSKPPLTAEELGVAQGEAALMMLLMRDTYVSLPTNEQDVSTLRASGYSRRGSPRRRAGSPPRRSCRSRTWGRLWMLSLPRRLRRRGNRRWGRRASGGKGEGACLGCLR